MVALNVVTAAAAPIDPICSTGYTVMKEAAVVADVKFDCIQEMLLLLLLLVASVEAAVADDTDGVVFVVVDCCILEPGS